MFAKTILNFPSNLFAELSNSVDFENVAKGRLGANLVDVENNLIPIVRTTTNYNKPNQKFLPVHHDIVTTIKTAIPADNLEFNNALIEIYNHQYCTMGFHTDQTLDLQDDSTICLYTCYNNPQTQNLRKLQVKNKTTGKIFNVVLEHNSIVVFTVDDNHKHQHKIILDTSNISHQDLWLGITFRQSKTFITFQNQVPLFYPENNVLTLANQNQCREFYKLKSIENNNITYDNPKIDYTLSKGDLINI